MAILDLFKPTWMVESIFNITPEELKNNNIHGVLADLDNTLIAWDNPESTNKTIDWIEMIQGANIPIVIISNNRTRRIQAIAETLNVPFISNAFKPSRRSYRKAFQLMDLEREDVVMVGDQLMTDIFGANRARVRNILVKPIVETDAGVTQINRKFEYIVMNMLLNTNENMEWRHSLDEPVRRNNN